MWVKRLVIIALSRSRGASLRCRRPRCTLRTALCYIFPPKYAINIPITTGSLRSFENLCIFKIQYFENFLLPFFGALGLLPLFSKLLWSSPGSTLPFPPTSLIRHPEKIPTKQVESPRLHIIGPLLLLIFDNLMSLIKSGSISSKNPVVYVSRQNISVKPW